MIEKIKKPQQIKELQYHELMELAKDVRKRIIEVTSKNGGHIAPSLGATDFIIALLKVFDPLEDRIVFDVGHQSYAYKILTERNDRFDTLRTYEGISGFNNIFESPYDAFGVGHSSTSISAALGICVAKNMQKQKGHSIAVIGDGALTGGMAFEALNHAGHLQKNFIVILNDNEMSISKNVGALQNHLTEMVTSKTYNYLKKQVWNKSAVLPTNLRRVFLSGAQRIEESMINILVPNIFFEDLNFKYVGPIDGHNIPRLIRIFNRVKYNMEGPILIHLLTKKGKGFSFAEKQVSKFHGIGPFDLKTGNVSSNNKQSWSEIFGNKLVALASKNKKIIAITAAMTDGTGLTAFSDKYPERFFDVGIAEQHAVTFAGGLAIQGMKPFVAIYSTFMQRALDQVIHDIALQKLPVVFCLDRAGIVGEDGATHHGVFDLSMMQFIPNMTIIAPYCIEELEQALEFAESYNDGPVIIRYPRGIAPSDPDYQKIEYGKSQTIIKGSKLNIIGIGEGVNTAKKLAEMIEEAYKFVPTVINLSFVKPLDMGLILDLIKDKVPVITIEENVLRGGIGEHISMLLNNHNVSVYPFALPDEFIPHGDSKILKDKTILTPEAIFAAINKKKIIEL
ncbi:MAG TPA: 1-deoxy-D-xylulose-5-phosphate synthase [Candidatus Cloacimonadota bacterium]|nr:1-deoxy-D-xylulose-5-phosphate synthase [Candidatus Cloacimonadota bacterium]HOQ80140.1 1-deoxy-D-xylulose-5-phosphate synthase [Candidatus Cloacimonadota bacterium]